MVMEFELEAKRNAERVGRYIAADSFPDTVEPAFLRDAVRDYPTRGGKRLRSALLNWTCGMFGGNPDAALPAAAAVEVYHNWTLTHDDVIDDDDTRRGHPSTHVAIRDALAESEMDICAKTAADLAILAGDIQHGWALHLLLQCSERGVSAATTSFLASRLATDVTAPLVSGEALDVWLSLGHWSTVSRDDVERMINLKTGALLQFCALAGAVVALDSQCGDAEIATFANACPEVASIQDFALTAGFAFQLVDDWLGVFGDERLGKPICSDLAESKPTLLVLDALANLADTEKNSLLGLMGHQPSEEEIDSARRLIMKSGAADRTLERASELIEKAKQSLAACPNGTFGKLLENWADFLVRRQF